MLGCLPCCCCCFSTVSVGTRSTYFLIFLVSIFVQWLYRDEAYKWFYDYIPAIDDDCGKNVHCAGYSGVYRIALANVLFHSSLCVGLWAVVDSKEPRAQLQNGLWWLKYLLYAALVICCFLIDNDRIIEFAKACRFFGGVFVLVQLLLLVDFAYTWNESWVRHMEEDTDGQGWKFKAGILAACVVLYALTMTGIVLQYVWFTTGSGCELYEFFISWTLIMVVAVTALSVMDKFNAGLLPAAVICGYGTYLGLSALLSQPHDTVDECNDLTSDESPEWMIAVGVAFTLAAVSFSAVRSAGKGADFVGTQVPTGGGVSGAGDDDSKVVDDEVAGVQYDYSFFHLTFVLASMYVAMLFTNWHDEWDVDSEGQVDVGETSMWIKVITQWISFLLYFWTLVAPLVFPNRDFTGIGFLQQELNAV